MNIMPFLDLNLKATYKISQVRLIGNISTNKTVGLTYKKQEIWFGKNIEMKFRVPHLIFKVNFSDENINWNITNYHNFSKDIFRFKLSFLLNKNEFYSYQNFNLVQKGYKTLATTKISIDGIKFQKLSLSKRYKKYLLGFNFYPNDFPSCFVNINFKTIGIFCSLSSKKVKLFLKLKFG